MLFLFRQFNVFFLKISKKKTISLLSFQRSTPKCFTTFEFALYSYHYFDSRCFNRFPNIIKFSISWFSRIHECRMTDVNVHINYTPFAPVVFNVSCVHLDIFFFHFFSSFIRKSKFASEREMMMEKRNWMLFHYTHEFV